MDHSKVLFWEALYLLIKDLLILIPLIKITKKKIIEFENRIKKSAGVFKNDPVIFSGDILTDDPHVNIKYILDTLFQNNIQSLMVEGGGITFSHFIDSKFFDELHVYYAPKLIGSGLPLYHGRKSLINDLELKFHKIQRFKNDIKIIYYRN